MSASTSGAEHATVPEGHIPHGTYRSYKIGFILSVILTAIPFILVMSGGLESRALTAIIVLLFAVVQIVVHMIYFLHMDFRVEGGWSMTSLVFTLIVLIICVAGTMWVMHNMDSNMMPNMEEMMNNEPQSEDGADMSEEEAEIEDSVNRPDGETEVPGQDLSPED